jgi:hypothetical protein
MKHAHLGTGTVRSWSVLIALLFAACASTKYGGRPVQVTLTTVEQEQAAAREAAAGTQEQPGAGAANAYLLTLDQWLEVDGGERLADIERHRLEGAPDQRRRATTELLADLAPYKCATQTPVDVLVFPKLHVFVAERNGALGREQFDPIHLRDERIVVVSIESDR